MPGGWLLLFVPAALGLPLLAVGVVLRLVEWGWRAPPGGTGSRWLMAWGALLCLPAAVICLAALAGLPRTEALVFPFRSRKGGGRLSPEGVSNRVRLMARQAGVKLSMHRLRKGFGCRVAQQLGKGNAPVLHDLMRYSSMQITMDYYANVGGALHDAINGQM
jgi:integrase